MSFSDYLYYLAHVVFKRDLQEKGDIHKYTRAIGPNYDHAMEAAYLVREQAIVATATGAALDLLGKDRAMPRHPGEADDLYRKRLLSAYRIYSADGTPTRIVELLQMAGYPNSRIDELFQLGLIIPLFDGSNQYNGSITHSGGRRWAEFMVHLGIEENRSFTAEDRKRAIATINRAKPAHTKLVNLILDTDLKDALPNSDFVDNALSLAAADMFLREGFRHNSQAIYGAVLQHDRRFLHSGQSCFYNRLVPGMTKRHFCNDESSDTSAILSAQDMVRVFANHRGWTRNNLKYGSAMAQEMTAADVLTQMDDTYREIAESGSITLIARLADPYMESLPHGTAARPSRKGELFYTGAWPHKQQRPRSGSQIYGDHLTRVIGPRRDGRHLYGKLPGGWIKVYGTRISLMDNPTAIFNDRTGHAFYKDGLTHGTGLMAADVNTNMVSLSQGDLFDLPLDAMSGTNTELSIIDTTKLTYSRSQHVPHDGGFIHSQTPFNNVEASSSLRLSDNCNGYSLYGGQELLLLHNGSGLRWKHQGNLLRLPFARHGSQWTRDGSRRYLEARARYSDLASMYDGISYHGRQRLLHDGSQGRTPETVPDDLTITARRGYRRIAV